MNKSRDSLQKFVWAATSFQRHAVPDASGRGSPISPEKNWFLWVAVAVVAWLLALADARADWPNTNATKFVQFPNVSDTGMDIYFGEYPVILADAGIVRNRLKVDATIHNARATITLRRDGGLADLVGERAEHGYEFRSAPSAGALYPIETYIIANRISELEPGAYHYGIRNHELERVRAGDLRRRISAAALGQDTTADTQATDSSNSLRANRKTRHAPNKRRIWLKITIHRSGRYIAHGLYTGLSIANCSCS